tara:strand:+ start:596 stop:1003 length:408 start_codon:yes stop_codon:yes gene_type:complete
LKKEENMLFFFIIFISVPLIEIFLFIKVGEIIGSLQTILLVVLTAIIGSILIKREGIKALNRFQSSRINEPNNIIKAVGDGLFIFVSGVLLLTPGFATDILGFILFLKLFRNIILKIILKKVNLSKISRFNDHNF